jgi:hypothetical protein
MREWLKGHCHKGLLHRDPSHLVARFGHRVGTRGNSIRLPVYWNVKGTVWISRQIPLFRAKLECELKELHWQTLVETEQRLLDPSS